MKILGTAMVNTGALAISSEMNFVALFLWTRLLDPGAFGSYALISATALLVNAMMFDWLRLVAGRLLYDPQTPSGINILKGCKIYALNQDTKLSLLETSFAFIRTKADAAHSVFVLGANTRDAGHRGKFDRELMAAYNTACEAFCRESEGWHFVSNR